MEERYLSVREVGWGAGLAKGDLDTKGELVVGLDVKGELVGGLVEKGVVVGLVEKGLVVCLEERGLVGFANGLRLLLPADPGVGSCRVDSGDVVAE